MSRLTARSIWFVSCVGIGLGWAYVDGIAMLAIAKTALVFSALFVLYMLVEAAWSKHRGDDETGD